MMRVVVLIVFGSLLVLGQAADAPAFEVASVKAAAPQGMGMMRVGTRGGPGTQDPGRFTCENCDLMLLLSQAYDLPATQISGPDSLRGNRFDITAKVPEGATKAQFREMIKNLLVERFKLAAHMEKKEMPIYELTLAKGGPKFKESAGPADQPDMGRGGPGPVAIPRPKIDASGVVELPPGRTSMALTESGKIHMRRVDETMANFAKALQGTVGRPVVDATGLTGKYDFELYFAGGAMMGRGMLLGGMPPPPPPAGGPAGGPPGAETNQEDNGPTIFSAVQEQLGLKLESKKGPVDLLMVDHVEKTPTEN